MAIVKTKGIVLRTQKYRETSIITDIFTEELGLRSYIVNGVRKNKSKFPAAFFQLGTINQFVVYEKGGGSLNRMKEVHPSIVYLEIPYKIQKSSVLLFLIELISKCIREKEPNEEMYHFLETSLAQLDRREQSVNVYPIEFMLAFTEYLGFLPLNNYQPDRPYFNLEDGHFSTSFGGLYELDSEISLQIHHMLENGMRLQKPISKSMRQKTIDAFILYYKYHIEGFSDLKTVEIYRQML